MTSFLGSETIIDAVVAKLQAELPTRIEQLNAEKNDDITIAAPEQHRYFVAAQRAIPGGGPAILVMDGPMTIAAGGEGPHSLNTQTQIAVFVMDEDQTEQRLSVRIQRLARVVIEAVWDGAPAEQLAKADGSQLAWKIRPTQTVPGVAFEPEGRGPALREFYTVIFTAWRFEGD